MKHTNKSHDIYQIRLQVTAEAVKKRFTAEILQLRSVEIHAVV